MAMDRRLNLFRLLLSVVMIVASGSSAVYAEPAESPFLDGVSAYQAGAYHEAIQSFQLAYAIKKSPNVSFNIAMSFEKLGDKKSAVEWWQRYRSHNPSDGMAIEQRVNALSVKSSPALNLSSEATRPISTLTTAQTIALGTGVFGVVTASILGGVAMLYSEKSHNESGIRAKERYGRQSRGYALTADVTWVIALTGLAYGGSAWLD